MTELDAAAADHAHEQHRDREGRCRKNVRAPSGVLIGCALDGGHGGDCQSRGGVSGPGMTYAAAALAQRTAADFRRSLPVITPDQAAMIDMVSANARLSSPRSLWFYEDQSPGAGDALRALAGNGLTVEATPMGVYLYRGNTLIASVYPTRERQS